jgi:hypothetical protein
MTRIHPGDLVQISASGRFYYAIILDNVRLFGGQLCFVLYRTSDQSVEASKLLNEPLDGFYEMVDFIWAKREDRLIRVAKKLDVQSLNSKVLFFKTTLALKEKATLWRILDREGNEVRRVRDLSEEEKRYPLYHRIDDVLMVQLVDQRWAPERDERI